MLGFAIPVLFRGRAFFAVVRAPSDAQVLLRKKVGDRAQNGKRRWKSRQWLGVCVLVLRCVFGNVWLHFC